MDLVRGSQDLSTLILLWTSLLFLLLLLFNFPRFFLEHLVGEVLSSVLLDHVPDLVEQLCDLSLVLQLVIEDVVLAVTSGHEVSMAWASIQQLLHRVFKLVSTGEENQAASVHIWAEDFFHALHQLVFLLSGSVQPGDHQEDMRSRSS